MVFHAHDVEQAVMLWLLVSVDTAWRGGSRVESEACDHDLAFSRGCRATRRAYVHVLAAGVC